MCKPTFSVHVYDMKHPCSAFLSTPTRHKVFRKKLHGNMIELAAAHDWLAGSIMITMLAMRPRAPCTSGITKYRRLNISTCGKC